MPDKKYIFFAYYFLKVGTFTSLLKDKKSEKKKSQEEEIKVFLTFLFDGRSTDKDRIQVWEVQKHTDPQHYL
jgi:hypothetical protein